MNPPPQDAEIPALRSHAAVVIPCYNAGARLRPVVAKALEVVNLVIVVNDGSTDGAVVAVEDLLIRRISFPANRGKGAALLAGFRAALELPQTGCVIVVDADGQHDPGEIPALYAAFITQHADLVIGARQFDKRTVPWRSRFGNRLTARLTSALFKRGALLKRRIPDTQSGFRLHGRAFLEAALPSIPEGRYETEMAILLNAIQNDRVIVSVPIKTIYETGNPSSHFRKVRDSFRIYRTLLSAAFGPHR